jgi:hypothetical protein
VFAPKTVKVDCDCVVVAAEAVASPVTGCNPPIPLNDRVVTFCCVVRDADQDVDQVTAELETVEEVATDPSTMGTAATSKTG